jgi:hypothetical protein
MSPKTTGKEILKKAGASFLRTQTRKEMCQALLKAKKGPPTFF